MSLDSRPLQKEVAARARQFIFNALDEEEAFTCEQEVDGRSRSLSEGRGVFWPRQGPGRKEERLSLSRIVLATSFRSNCSNDGEQRRATCLSFDSMEG